MRVLWSTSSLVMGTMVNGSRDHRVGAEAPHSHAPGLVPGGQQEDAPHRARRHDVGGIWHGDLQVVPEAAPQVATDVKLAAEEGFVRACSVRACSMRSVGS